MPICQSHTTDRERFTLTPPISTVIKCTLSTPTHRWKGSKGAARASACMGATQWWHLLLWYYFRTAPARGPSSSHMVTDSLPGEQSECLLPFPAHSPVLQFPEHGQSPRAILYMVMDSIIERTYALRKTILFAVSFLFIIAATWIHPRAISIAHDLFRLQVKRFELSCEKFPGRPCKSEDLPLSSWWICATVGASPGLAWNTMLLEHVLDRHDRARLHHLAPASQPPGLLLCVTESKCLTARL